MDSTILVSNTLQLLQKEIPKLQNKIESVAAENGHELDQYDTTLSLVVFIGDRLYYGHSGDSGIIAMNTEGIYEKVTDQQRDSDGRVFPLYFGEDKWVFGRY